MGKNSDELELDEAVNMLIAERDELKKLLEEYRQQVLPIAHKIAELARIFGVSNHDDLVKRAIDIRAMALLEEVPKDWEISRLKRKVKSLEAELALERGMELDGEAQATD